MGKDGFENEELIINAINNKKFSELNSNLQEVVKYIHNDNISSNTVIKAYKIAGQNKTDVNIEVKDKKYNLSIKKGTGNSIHQEKVEEFIDFLEDTYSIEESLIEDIKFFIWGDGTLDGTGSVSDRLKASELKSMFPDRVNNIREFFHLHKKDLIERFLIKGVKSDSSPDFMYYGNPEEGVIVKASDALDWLADDKNEKISSPIPVGR